MKWNKALLLIAAGLAFSIHASQAQTLVDIWSYEGGGLAPATYSGTFRPSPLTPDAGSNGGGTISVSGVTTGGLGSSGFPDGYGGYYTLFSSGATFTLQSTTILTGIDTLTISFLAGGGFPTLVDYNSSSLTLNYNGSNPALASSSFSAIPGFIVESPIGDQDLTLYTWTWTGLSDLGASTGFSTSWNVQGQQHVFFGEFTATQAVPEPSALGMIAVGGVLLCLRKRKSRTVAHR